MYKVCGFTNYECNCGDTQVFCEEQSLENAMSMFLSLVKNFGSLDFTELDTLIDEWALDCDWDEDDYYAGSYGGCIILYDEAINDGDFDREVVLIRVERDPIRKTNNYGEIELGAEITTQEKEVYSLLLNKQEVPRS